MGGRPAVVILRKGLGDKVKEVRITAVVEDLGFIGGRVALLVLSEALRTAPRARIPHCGGHQGCRYGSGHPHYSKGLATRMSRCACTPHLCCARSAIAAVSPYWGKWSSATTAPRSGRLGHVPGSIGAKERGVPGILAKVLNDKEPRCTFGRWSRWASYSCRQRRRFSAKLWPSGIPGSAK